MHAPTFSKPAAMLSLLVLSFTLSAQKKPTPGDTSTYYHNIQFIQQASDIVNKAIRNEDWTLLQHFTENWQRADRPSDELIFGIATLLAIKNNHFSVLQLPCDFMFLLDDYAKECRKADEGSSSFTYHIQLSSKYWYNATKDVEKLLPVIRSWALHLKASRKLGNTELFFCKVFSGEILHPRSVFRSDQINYPELIAFERGLEASNQSVFAAHRKSRTSTTGIMVGTWLPTGKLSTLGIHPSVGISLGIRNKKNEYDVVWSFRFLHPTSKNYQVLREDSVFTTNYYDGGYAGLDYTRYVIHKTRYEFGLVSGIGYDYFSVASGFNNSDYDPKLLPLNVGSFDFSNGVRFKYFLGPKSYVGVVGKYHLINYCNTGGTDLSGHAFTIDLLFGSH